MFSLTIIVFVLPSLEFRKSILTRGPVEIVWLKQIPSATFSTLFELLAPLEHPAFTTYALNVLLTAREGAGSLGQFRISM
jgi:hypothetical protein